MRCPRRRPLPKNPRALHERVVALRKQNCSIYDIQRALQERDERLSAPAIWKILTAHGFAKLPRRADEERPLGARVEVAPVADARAFSLEPLLRKMNGERVQCCR